MIAFATVVGNREKYAAYAQRSLQLLADPESLIIEIDDQTSMFSAYNEILDAVAEFDGVEALVLLHEDVSLRSAKICDTIRDLIDAHPEVAVFGVTGGRQLTGIAWWEGTMFGRAEETRTTIQGEPGFNEVEAVDGMLMVLSPWAIKHLRYETDAYEPSFHGYDAELCFLARAQGKKVAVAEIPVFHHTKGGYGDELVWRQANNTFVRRWLTAAEQAQLPGSCLVPAGECVACGNSLPPVASVVWRSLVTCRRCGLGHTVPPPTRDIAGDHVWEGPYAGRRASRRGQWIAEARLRAGWIRSHVGEGSRLLDVGCATGELVEVAAEVGLVAFGIEPSRSAAEQARLAGVGNIFEGTIEEWTAAHPGLRVDAASLFHVLEHVEAPVTFLADVKAALRADGLLFVEVPNFASTAATRNPFAWVGADRSQLNEHVAHYTPSSLSWALAAAGFEIDEIDEIDYSVYTPAASFEQLKEQYSKLGYDHLPKDLLRIVAKVSA